MSGVPDGSTRRLVLQKKAGNTWEYEKTVDSWARSGDVDVVSGLESGETYRLALIVNQSGREVEYGTSEELTGITGRKRVEVAYAERTVTTVKPQVYAGENQVSSSYTLTGMTQKAAAVWWPPASVMPLWTGTILCGWRLCPRAAMPSAACLRAGAGGRHGQ